MAQGFFGIIFFLVTVVCQVGFSTTDNWYAYYIQCVNSSTQESLCYEAIRDYLSTDEGRQQAREIGFKRRLVRDTSQLASQAVVILSRIQQMEKYLQSAIEKAKEDNDGIRSYCLNDKNQQISAVKRSIEEKKLQLFEVTKDTPAERVEGDYQVLLSLNTRANEIYVQARKCLD